MQTSQKRRRAAKGLRKNIPALSLQSRIRAIGNSKGVILAPLTHTIKGYPSRVTSVFDSQPGEIVLDQIRGVDKSRLKKKMGTINVTTAANIKTVLVTMFS